MDELAGLTGEARKRALDRFHLLQPHLENDRPLKAVAAAAGIPFRTAQRWVSLYRQLGLAALARRKRTDTGELTMGTECYDRPTPSPHPTRSVVACFGPSGSWRNSACPSGQRSRPPTTCRKRRVPRHQSRAAPLHAACPDHSGASSLPSAPVLNR